MHNAMSCLPKANVVIDDHVLCSHVQVHLYTLNNSALEQYIQNYN